MKHFFVLLAAILTLFLLAGCSSAADELQTTAPTASDTPPTPIMDVLSNDMRAIYENRDSALPVAVIYTSQGEGGRSDSPLYGEAAVNEALNAIADIVIIAETDGYGADCDSSYTFMNADGAEAGSISFNGGNLVVGGQTYEVDNVKALAAIDFPAETLSDTLTIDGPDPMLAEFCERIGSEKPVAIKVVSNDSEYEITDADIISECINELHSIGLTFAWKGASEPETSLVTTFVMNDDTQYSLTFYDESVYIYEFPQPLGMWSYLADGAAYFIEALKTAK